MTFDFSILRHFQLPYCNTCYSMQSATITEKYTVFDCNTPYVDRNFIWTALTRATDLKNITIFEHSIEECQVLEESKKKQKLTLKIEGYKTQDKQAKRTFNTDDYVNVDWINSQEQKCFHCGIHFYYHMENGDAETNLTVDRIDNHIAHVKKNCRLCCINCNVARK